MKKDKINKLECSYSDINQKSIYLSEKIYNNYINYDKGIIKFNINGETVDILVFRNHGVSKLLVYINDGLVIHIENHFNEQFTKSAILSILVRYFNLFQLNYGGESDYKNDGSWNNPNRNCSQSGLFFKYFLKQIYVDYRTDVLLDLENFDWSIFTKTTFPQGSKQDSVFNHPELNTYLYISYPELRRGSIVDNYYGVDSMKGINKNDILISKNNKRYKVIHTKTEDGVKTAMLVKDHKVSCDQPLLINKKHIKYIIDKKEIEKAWSALFSCNRTSRKKHF